MAAEQEAMRHKALAETEYSNSNLKSALKHANKAYSLCPNLEGLSSMLTAFKILLFASKSSVGTAPDWYKILQVEPFSNINTIKKQYRKLALILHPDKNPYLGCEEAFKLVGEGFRVFTDKIRRKEYDMKLRIRIQEERVEGLETDAGGAAVETFSTACSRCKLLHKFERKYLGHNLVCPGCKKSFEAVEVDGGETEKESGKEDQGRVRLGSERLKRKMGSVQSLSGMGLKGQMDSGESVARKGKMGSSERKGSVGLRTKESNVDLREKQNGSDVAKVGGGEWSGGRLRRRMSTVGDVLARSKANRAEEGEMERPSLKKLKVCEETMTLAEMRLEMKRKANQGKVKSKLKEKDKNDEEKENKRDGRGASKKTVLEDEGTSEKNSDLEISNHGTLERSLQLEAETRRDGKKTETLKVVRGGTSRKKGNLKNERHTNSERRDLEIMAVEDSDFYDFDKDRMERSFKKGQVWAIYDDSDGMPRHYGLVDEVVSVNPFEVKMSWLDLQNNGDEGLTCLVGLQISCGRFKVSRKTSIKSVNIFSHIVECERAAKEMYRIFPNKGSVWALNNAAALGAQRRNLSAREKPCYDIVVLLTSYSEIHGLSMAYLEKVDGFKTIFKRKEIGCHAIRWIEKDDVCLFSHQIPARKLAGEDVPDHLKDCWELDPASLPADLPTIGRQN